MKKILLTVATLALATMGLMAQPYYVAGDAALCNGVNWGQTASENQMTDNAGTYSITFTDVPAGSYSFKITSADAWMGVSSGSYSTSGDCLAFDGGSNAQFTTSSAGDVTITFDGANGCVTGNIGVWTLNMVTVVCDGLPNEVYIDGSVISGTINDPSNINNDMILQAGSWTKTYDNLSLEVGQYGCKVVANNSWIKEYPGSGAYQPIEILEAGTYKLDFTFNGDFDAPILTIEPALATAVEETAAAAIYAANGTIYADQDITIYNFAGQDVTAQNGALAAGNYIVKTAKGAQSIAVK